MATHHLLERRAVVQVHLLERFVDLLENTTELVWLDMCLNHGQDSAELLILLFEAKFLIHIGNTLLQSCLEGRDLITQLLLLIFGRRWHV